MFSVLLCLSTEPRTVCGTWKELNKYMGKRRREGRGEGWKEREEGKKTNSQEIAKNSKNEITI